MTRRRDGDRPYWRDALAEDDGGEGVVAAMLGRDEGRAAPRGVTVPVVVEGEAPTRHADVAWDVLAELDAAGHRLAPGVADAVLTEAERVDADRAAARRRAGHWREAVGDSTAAAMLGGSS